MPNDMESMRTFADQLWKYMVPKLDSKFASNVSYFRARVVSNPGNNMLEVERPLETGTLTLPCVRAMSGAQTGQQVVALVMGSLSNAIVVADGKLNTYFLPEASLFDLTPAVFQTNQKGISINTGTNLRTADLIYNYLSSDGHNLSGTTFRCLCLTSGRVTYSTTGSSFVLYKSDFKPVPTASEKKLLMTVRRFRENVGSSTYPPQIYVATYDANGKIWWANVSTTGTGYYRQRYYLDSGVFTNGNICIFVQFRKPTHTIRASFDLDIVAGDSPISASNNYSEFTDSGFTVQDDPS